MLNFATRLTYAGLALLAHLSTVEAAPCSEPNSISRVRNRAPSGSYEYVVFNFIKPTTVPNYTVTSVSPPFVQDPSGQTITIAGSTFKEIRFSNVVWTCSIEEIFNLPKQAIQGIGRTGQFEGEITYVVGAGSSSRFIDSYSYDAGGIRKIVMRYRK